MTTYSEWKSQIEGFDKLVVKLPEGVSVQPLYVEAPPLHVPGMPAKCELVEPPLPQAGEGWGEGRVSAVALHELGADAADELAFALSAGATLQKLDGVVVQLAVGRDTFLELCKLRALRICWAKLATVAGVPDAKLIIHAVSSKRTLTISDPWVNMLRVTTQTFAAILGGADFVTPASFDDAMVRSELGARVARNTQLVLHHESGLGAVIDPTAGSYYLDTFTDQLAREAWKRFQAMEAEGGLEKALPGLKARVEKAWSERLASIAKRKIPILGVSEFANVDEVLPTARQKLEHRHDSEQFEALRVSAEAFAPKALLVALGTIAESRARVGFALNFLAAGGIKAREVSADEKEVVAVLCGTDERYATDAVPRAKALKAAGCTKVLLAGRPGANEAELRAAGVDGFIFIGCDLVETLGNLLEAYP